jgi:hypothetical protein
VKSGRASRTRVVVIGLIAVFSQTMIVPQHVAASASTPRQSESTVAASPPFVFDDFNRTVTSGWGTSTAGVPWDVQYNAFTNVPTSVDGQSGVIGSEANNEDAFMRVIANSPGIPLPWKDRQFEFTGRFKTGYVDQSSYICFGLYKDDTPKSAGFCAGFGPDRSDLSVGAFGVGQQIDFHVVAEHLVFGQVALRKIRPDPRKGMASRHRGARLDHLGPP